MSREKVGKCRDDYGSGGVGSSHFLEGDPDLAPDLGLLRLQGRMDGQVDLG